VRVRVCVPVCVSTFDKQIDTSKGNLHESDRMKDDESKTRTEGGEERESSLMDPYVNDPERSSILRVLAARPFNAGLCYLLKKCNLM